jgi:hypothetical protein
MREAGRGGVVMRPGDAKCDGFVRLPVENHYLSTEIVDVVRRAKDVGVQQVKILTGKSSLHPEAVETAARATRRLKLSTERAV